jgi:periplasmic mercuric ion binding protein
MRLFGFGLLCALAVLAGCDKPSGGMPGPGGPSGTSGVTADVPEVTIPAQPAAAPADAPATTDGAALSRPAAGQLVSTSLKVPTMHCPHGCWPTVKETLAKQPGVESVELAKQSQEGEIDNPVVLVQYQGKFDSTAAIAALAEAGFEQAEVAN